MIEVEPYAKIINVPDRAAGIAMLRHIEWCARLSHASEGSQTEDSWDRFLRSVVLDHGDFSVIEHSFVTVDMLVDRGITHEVVRHRLFGFTQSSTRFINHVKKTPPTFISPFPKGTMQYEMWKIAIEASESAYRDIIASGAAPQFARSVLPNSLASRIAISGNLRNWRHFLLMRTTKESHPQMREVTIPLLRQFQERIPILFEDIEPLALQRENMRKPR